MKANVFRDMTDEELLKKLMNIKQSCSICVSNWQPST